MFFLNSIFCRAFQGVFRLAIPLLPYRQPEIMGSCNDIGRVIEKEKFRSALLVTDKGIAACGLCEPMIRAISENGFDFTLKCICSGAFALLGVVNLGFAIKEKANNIKFFSVMSLGLILAMLGDVLIGYDFIVGAGTFAMGHVCFIIAYCFHRAMSRADVAISSIIFILALAFLLFCPLLSFEVPVFKIVCIVYAFIISSMLGKAVGNFIKEKSRFGFVVMLASALFFFSDLMLVFDWFIGLWDWTSHACMGTYYPALCFLAFSMYLKLTSKEAK